MNMVGTTVRSGVSLQCVDMSVLKLALIKPFAMFEFDYNSSFACLHLVI